MSILREGKGLTGRGGNVGGEVEGVLSSSEAKERTGIGNCDGGGALGRCAEGCKLRGASIGGPAMEQHVEPLQKLVTLLSLPVKADLA